jgi:hypothetical protein
MQSRCSTAGPKHNDGSGVSNNNNGREDSSFTIDEWCDHRRVSRSMFYKLRGKGKAPRTHNAGTKQLISPEADRDWIREREAEAAQVIT